MVKYFLGRLRKGKPAFHGILLLLPGDTANMTGKTQPVDTSGPFY